MVLRLTTLPLPLDPLLVRDWMHMPKQVGQTVTVPDDLGRRLVAEWNGCLEEVHSSVRDTTSRVDVATALSSVGMSDKNIGKLEAAGVLAELGSLELARYRKIVGVRSAGKVQTQVEDALKLLEG